MFMDKTLNVQFNRHNMYFCTREFMRLISQCTSYELVQLVILHCQSLWLGVASLNVRRQLQYMCHLQQGFEAYTCTMDPLLYRSQFSYLPSRKTANIQMCWHSWNLLIIYCLFCTFLTFPNRKLWPCTGGHWYEVNWILLSWVSESTGVAGTQSAENITIN